jgi:hypothetical protein
VHQECTASMCVLCVFIHAIEGHHRIMEERRVQCAPRGRPGEGLPLVFSAYGYAILMSHTLLR